MTSGAEEDKKYLLFVHSLDMASTIWTRIWILKAGRRLHRPTDRAFIELKMKEVTRVRMTTHRSKWRCTTACELTAGRKLRSQWYSIVLGGPHILIVRRYK